MDLWKLYLVYASANNGFRLEDYPDQYAFLASEWRDDQGNQVVMFEKYH